MNRVRPGALSAAPLLVLVACASHDASPPEPAPPETPSDHVTITFLVTVPEETPAGEPIQLAGSFQGWNPGDPAFALRRREDGRWTIPVALERGRRVEFKFARGSWERVEKGARGEEIANRSLTPSGDATIEFAVAAWADLGPEAPSTVVGDVRIFAHEPFLDGRTIRVYLPPGYERSGARYPVLYLHDGQNLFDARTSFAGEWRIDESCEALIASGEIAPLIVVGIDNAGVDRIHEYTPWPDAGRGGGADAYLRAIRDRLKPEIDRRFRTRPEPEHTWMAGSSLGGLVSAYAGYAHDETFRRVAAVSPSYRWADHRMIEFARARGRPALDRFYQDMGSRETEGRTADRDGDGVDDLIAALRAMEGVALAQGFVPGEDFLSIEAEGHVHNERDWARRVPELLRFLVGPPVP